MRFNDWVRKNTTKIDSIDDIENKSYFGIRNDEMLKTVYNFFKDMKLLDYMEIYDPKDLEYNVLVFSPEINLDELFSIIKLIDRFQYLNKIVNNDEKEEFKKLIMYKSIENIDTDEFYCMFTLSPIVYTIDHIYEVEEVMNEYITFKTNFDLLYDEFKEIMKNDRLAAIIKSHFPDCLFIAFNSIEEFDTYLEAQTHFNRIETESSDDLISDEVDLSDIINKLNLNEDTDIEIRAYDENNGKIIDLGEYRKNNKNLN